MAKLMPLVGFYWRQHETINALLGKQGSAESQKLLLDVINALLPVVREHWPLLNRNGLLDDFEQTINEVLGPDGQQSG